ncbi:hypothetical protein AB0E06_25010 [Streptomyces sp. NPDC048109]|uniref:hypothetical protein n=1 Tax=unclassified Streptomyces TaxID=2593676 RepID=UPI00341045C6
MRHDPTLLVGDTLVVFDGEPRLLWQRSGPTGWTPAQLWPDTGRREELAAHVRRGAPLLVVVDGLTTSVTVFEDELSTAPEAIRSRATVRDGLGDIAVEPFDWLPPDLRARGRRFLDQALRDRATTPLALRPPLLLDRVGLQDAPHIRFALRAGHGSCSEAAVRAVVRHLFGSSSPAPGNTGSAPATAHA